MRILSLMRFTTLQSCSSLFLVWSLMTANTYSIDSRGLESFPVLPIYRYLSEADETQWVGRGAGYVWADFIFRSARVPFVPLAEPIALVSSPPSRGDCFEVAALRCGVQRLGSRGCYDKSSRPENIIIMDLFTLHFEEDVQASVQAATNLRTLIMPYMGIKSFDWSTLPPKLENLHIYKIRLKPTDLAVILAHKNLRVLEMVDCDMGNIHPMEIESKLKSGGIELTSLLRELTIYTRDPSFELAFRKFKYPRLKKWTCPTPLISLRPKEEWPSYLPLLTELNVIYKFSSLDQSCYSVPTMREIDQKMIERHIPASFTGKINYIPHRSLVATMSHASKLCDTLSK